MKTRTMFLHTLDGQPAEYIDGEQIVFANAGRYTRRGIRLAFSIAEIKQQQRASERWRAAQGLGVGGFNHSYVRVEVPA